MSANIIPDPRQNLVNNTETLRPTNYTQPGSVGNGFQNVSVSSGSTLTPPTGSRFARIQVESANVRWRDDGTSPTTTVGALLTPTSSDLIYSGDLTKVKFTAVSGSPTLNVIYYT